MRISRIKAFKKFEWVWKLFLLDPEGIKEIGIFQECVRLSLSWNFDRGSDFGWAYGC